MHCNYRMPSRLRFYGSSSSLTLTLSDRWKDKTIFLCLMNGCITHKFILEGHEKAQCQLGLLCHFHRLRKRLITLNLSVNFFPSSPRPSTGAFGNVLRMVIGHLVTRNETSANKMFLKQRLGGKCSTQYLYSTL